ncbi:MAG: hypothetical protein KJP16_11250 [Gammaproteobacteria bacterium]|nr:hypothetical protein [Gammaproteobacteria bacterium]
MNAWGQSCQAADQSLRSAVDAMGDLITCFNRDINGKSRITQRTVKQMARSLNELSDSLETLTVSVSGVADAQSSAILSFLAGNRLDREQFYVLLATECVEWTNKNVGLSDFDDFELFDLLRHEANGQSGYIYLAPDIDDLPDVDPDDWTLGFLSRTYRKAIIPPGAIEWTCLSPRQRTFFQKYLPQVVGRFIHDGSALPLPNPRKAGTADSATSASVTKARVNIQEFVSALRALKVHLKARRKLDVLIRNGDRKGELVLELSGRSKYAGMLATVNCDGNWNTKTLVPNASLRGFVGHPPVDETSCLTFHNGRLHIGVWNCPARVDNAE